LNSSLNMNFILPAAFVLLNCDLGFEGEIIEQLQQLDIVKEVNGTFGAYDILAKLESSSSEDINMAISTKIRKFSNVKTSMTLLTMGS